MSQIEFLCIFTINNDFTFDTPLIKVIIKLPNLYWMMKLCMGNDEICLKRVINFDTDESLPFGQLLMGWVGAVNKYITLNL